METRRDARCRSASRSVHRGTAQSCSRSPTISRGCGASDPSWPSSGDPTVRSAFRTAFDAGYRAVHFVRDDSVGQRRGFYVLEPSEDLTRSMIRRRPYNCESGWLDPLRDRQANRVNPIHESRSSPSVQHYQGLRKGGRSLALLAPLVQLGFLGLGLAIFLDQSRSLLSDAQFTWGERNVMGIDRAPVAGRLRLRGLGGRPADQGRGRALRRDGRHGRGGLADDRADRATGRPDPGADRDGAGTVGPRTDRAGATPPGQALR